MRQFRILSKWRRLIGTTLLEALAVMGIASTALVGSAYYANQTLNERQGELTANYMREFNLAATRYVNANMGTYIARPSGFVEDIVPTPAVNPTTFSNPQFAPFIREGFVLNTPMSLTQRPALRVRKVGNQIEAWTYTTGGASLPANSSMRSQLPIVASQIGPNTGLANPADPATPTIRAVTGAWNIPQATLAATLGRTIGGTGTTSVQTTDFVSTLTLSGVGAGPGGSTNSYLYRDVVAGFPELNRMNTHLDMGNNDINNARNGVFSGRVDVSQDIWAGGYIRSERSITARYDIGAENNVFANNNVSASNNVRADHGDVSAGRYMKVGTFQTVTYNGWCDSGGNESGVIAKTSSNQLAKCEDNRWRPLAETSQCKMCVTVSNEEVCTTMVGDGTAPSPKSSSPSSKYISNQGERGCGKHCEMPHDSNLFAGQFAIRMDCSGS